MNNRACGRRWKYTDNECLELNDTVQAILLGYDILDHLKEDLVEAYGIKGRQ